MQMAQFGAPKILWRRILVNRLKNPPACRPPPQIQFVPIHSIRARFFRR
jgi:hypothetical protein